MSAADAVAAQVVASRRRNFEPAPGKTITYQLPSAFRNARMVDAMVANDGDAIIELQLPLLVSWGGITEAMLLGSGVGSDAVAPLTPDTARALLADRPQWVVEMAMHMSTEASEAAKRLKEQAGN